MSGFKNNSADPKKQAAPNQNLSACLELEAKILSALRMAVCYADLSSQHYEIFDNFGFDRSVEEFIGYAKDVANLQKKLRGMRGATK
jgi:hypothetical protein